MGDPRYIDKLAEIYKVTFGNVDEKMQKEILLLIKQSLTKKEYKLIFQFMDYTHDELLKALKCEDKALELIKKKASRKLKESVLQNKIIAIAQSGEKE